MKLSIITVNLNNRCGLKRTIESVVSQTFKEFEWIVIDGGSTDGSRELLEEYSSFFSYCVSEPDKGIFNAMNKGVTHASGEYVLFLNSGDWLADNGVLADVAETPFVGSIVYGNTYVMDGVRMVREKKYGELSFQFMISSSLCHQSSFILRNLLIQSPYNESLKIASDWEFWLKMILKGEKFQFFDRFVSCYDMNGISGTNLSLNKQERQLVFNSIVPQCIMYDYKTGKIEELIELKRKYRLFSKFITFCTMAMNKIDKFLQRCRK